MRLNSNLMNCCMVLCGLLCISSVTYATGCQAVPGGVIETEYLRSESDMEQEQDDSDLHTIYFPESLFTFSGMTKEEIKDSYLQLGNEYYTDVYIQEDDSFILIATEDQIQHQIDDNNTWVNELADEFEAANPKYSYEGSIDYTSLTFTFDEKIDTDLEMKTLLGITCMYAFNTVLLGNPEWNVDVVVKNCHTDKVVTQASLPKESLEYGLREWEDSYVHE